MSIYVTECYFLIFYIRSVYMMASFSHHARVRQEQRNIDDNSVSAVMQSGEQLDCLDTKIYTDQNIKVVLAKDSNTVITVNKNTRNTKFQLSERTKKKEESLIYKANVQKNDHAMCELAELYLTGELGEKDIRKAYGLFEKAAKRGNSHAMCRISGLYEEGILGDCNQELADKWLKKAADRNNVYALALIGQKLLVKYIKKYPPGSNIFRPSAPKKEILDYLNKAADKGSSRAIWQLGNIYEEGFLGEQDLSKAQELYIKAAKTGSPASLTSLHQMCLDGSFSETELEEILDYCSSFLGTTSIGMCLQLGEEQLFGILGFNPARGFKMIEQAALKGNEEAIQTLTQCYLYRDGYVDLKLSQYWFMKLYELYDISAKAGNIISLLKLGKLYLEGKLNNIDLQKAESCYKEAIEKFSDPCNIYMIGQLYWQGRLGDKPTNIGLQLIKQAIDIWQLKAADGDKTVFNYLGKAFFFINSFKNCVYWLSQSSNDDVDSQLFLAKIYLDELLPEKNIPLGLKILKRIILEHDVAAQDAFKTVNFKINGQTLSWLQEIADNIKKPMSKQISNQYRFHRFILTFLAKTYEQGHSENIINYNEASKYYYQLFIDFQSVYAGNKLVAFYTDQNLPIEYHDTAKNWALQMPTLIETDEIPFDYFRDCVLLLAKMHQTGSLLSYDIKEATKWFLLALYISDDKNSINEVENNLTNLPQLNCEQKDQIVGELSQIASNINITSTIKYKVFTRVLGDIFYGKKIINQDMDKAIYWYIEASKKNNSKASLALAKIYQHDKQDIDASVKWYKTSIKQGNKIALKTLISMADELNSEDVFSFLKRYKHNSSVEESELINVKPLMNLQSYPENSLEMYELGKKFLNSEDNMNILNAAFWFRKAMNGGILDAAVELCSMYKSGMLGINLIPVADQIYLFILKLCFYQLKKSALHNKNTSLILSSLNKLLATMKIGSTPNALNVKLEKLINQTHNIDSEMLKDILSDLAGLIQLEYHSNEIECTTSATLEKTSLNDEASNSTSWAFEQEP